MDDMKNQHACQALAIHCIDFRFQKDLNEYLEDRFPGAYDRIAVAGGVKSLLEDAASGGFELDQCAVSYKLHHPKIILLFQHEDCGAYGGSKEFANPEAERSFQAGELQKAEKVIVHTFPDVAVERFFVLLSGEFVPV
jgi:hypothetical protein